MRELSDHGTLPALSSGVYSALQLCTNNEPLFPNLTTLDWSEIEESFVPFLPLFLSPRITSISFGYFSVPSSVVASVITNLPTPCPDLQDINLPLLPSDPIITTAVSSMFSVINQNTLRGFCVDSPLTEETSEAVYKSQNLRNLSVVIEDGTSIPSVSLPNLIRLHIKCEDGGNVLQLLRRGTFGKLESIDFNIESTPIDDFLEAFKGAALSSSIQNTLSTVRLITDSPWNPRYSVFLPFTRLVVLEIQSPCDENCPAVNDDIIIDLSRAMPKLESLKLGDWPCEQFTGGVTVKGLVALARNCPNLRCLCVHFQVASLIDPPTSLETANNPRYPASWTDCALTRLEVGAMLLPEGSAPLVALTLVRIFPRIECLDFEEGWFEVEDMICCLR